MFGTVIVTDDSMLMRNCIKMVLKKRNFEVEEASSGHELIRMYPQINPEFVTLDIDMPDMNGIDVLKKLKKKYPDAKVLICSSKGQRDIVIECAKEGAAGFFVKPIDMKKLNKCINDICN